MTLLDARILVFVLCASSFVISHVSSAAQDHVEPNVELIPTDVVADDEESLALRDTHHHHQQHPTSTKTPEMHTDRSPHQSELQQVLQFIEEKFLSFAALNVRPNFANVFRHMERIARAFVKLSNRVDSVHAQLEDMSNHQQNCSSNQQVSVLMDTVTTRLNELDRKIDHLERQVQYPPSYGLTKNLEGMSGQLRHIQESLEHMERANIHFASEGLRRNTPPQSQMSTELHTILTKINDVQHTLGDIASTKHTENTASQLSAVLVQGLDRKIDDLAQIVVQQSGMLQHHINNATRALTPSITESNFATLVEKQHNSTNQLLLQLVERQEPPPSIKQHLERIPDLLKIVQDLPGVTTDAMDRAEVMFARIQDKMEGIHVHVSDNQQTMSKLETNFEEILDKIEQVVEESKHTGQNLDIHDTVTQPPTSHSNDNLTNNNNHTLLNSIQKLNNSDDITLLVLMKNLDLRFKDLQTFCQPKFEHERGSFSEMEEKNGKMVLPSHHSDHETRLNESDVLTSTLQRLDQSSNNTQDKLDYIASAMASFQADHSSISFSLEELMRQMGKLQQKTDEVLKETEILKLVKKQDSNNHLTNSTEQLLMERLVNNSSHQVMSEKIYDILVLVKNKIDDLHHIRHEKKLMSNHHDLPHMTHDSINKKHDATAHTDESPASEDVDSTYYEAVIKHLMQLQAIVDKLSTAMSERNPSGTTCPSKEWDIKIERLLTHTKHNLDHLANQIPGINETAAAVSSALIKFNGHLTTLTGNEGLELQETKKISERIDTLHAKVDLINNDSLSRVMRLIDVGEKSKNGNQTWELMTTATLQTIYDRVAEVDQDVRKIETAIHKGIDALTEKLKSASNSNLNMHSVHTMQQAPTHLSLHHSDNETTTDGVMTDDLSTGNHGSDDTAWRFRSDITYSMQSVMDDKLDKMKINIQNIVDNGVFQFVDFIGQQKMMMQNSMSSFINQQNENVATMMETLATKISKGFEDVHFMYQLISGKMDKIYHITAHNLEDCADIQRSGHTQSGVYTIYPRNSKELRVYCDMETEGGGWTVIQRRGDYGDQHRTSFNQTWVDYKYGFGNLEREFWMGNENIHVLTSQGNYNLRIDLLYADPDPKLPRHRRKIWHNLKNTSRLYAQYKSFHVQSERHNYTMTHKGYKGIHPHDGLEGRSGYAFTTWDHANDINLQHCAKIQGGGWWYGVECFRFALNSKHKNHYWEDGNLFTGITWGGTADIALLKNVEMKILPHVAHKRPSEHIPSVK